MNKNLRTHVLIFSSFALIGLVTFLSGFEFLSAQGVVPKPSNSWIFDAKGVSSQRISDKAGRFSGKTIGVPSFKQIDAHSFYEFHGTDGFLLKENATGAEPGMPHEKFSLSSWIRIDEGTTNGGIIGCIQDNGNFEKGWLLGYDNEKFNFILSSQGADDGDGKITTLRSKSSYQKGKWYHLATSYDGASMRIFINGKLEGESKAQSKSINYASAAPFIIGRYRDDDEDFGLVGAIKEINLYQSALSADQIAALFEKDAALASLAPIPLPTGFVIAPYLQFPTKSSITIMWETSAPASSTVKFGTKLPLEMFATKEGTSLIHEVLLEKLEPATKYFYQVESKSDAGGIALSGVLTFQTAVVDDEPFSFCVIGDTQKNPKMTGKVMKLIWERRPHFLMHVGDVVDNGPDKNEWVNELFKPSIDLLCRVPVFPTIGNHEKNHEHYYNYFSLPKPEYYYRYSYGNADFFVLDSNKSLLPLTQQYTWLEKELASSKATWKIVYHHHPAYSSDDNDYGDTWVGGSNLGDKNTRSIVHLYEKYGVDMVFNGHVHVYERTLPIKSGKVDRLKGITYVTSGGGGGSLENFAPNPTWFKAEIRSDYHFCQISIIGKRLNLKAFDHEGRLFDQWDKDK